tara:strand:+ start:1770 stop:2042 length:273 start_codon:yes stop_codon:yes gene_type:complete
MSSEKKTEPGGPDMALVVILSLAIAVWPVSYGWSFMGAAFDARAWWLFPALVWAVMLSFLTWFIIAAAISGLLGDPANEDASDCGVQTQK